MLKLKKLSPIAASTGKTVNSKKKMANGARNK
jgi:hypothetical protein